MEGCHGIRFVGSRGYFEAEELLQHLSKWGGGLIYIFLKFIQKFHRGVAITKKKINSRLGQTFIIMWFSITHYINVLIFIYSEKKFSYLYVVASRRFNNNSVLQSFSFS